MSASAWGYGLPPDDPARRAYWVVPLAALLVLLAMLGLGELLSAGTPRAPAPPPPVQAEIYELPAVKGPLPAPGRQHAAPTPPSAPAARSTPAQPA
nr:hypothetical protein [Betaproteobacteria bacterium]